MSPKSVERDSSFSPDAARDTLKHFTKHTVFFALENVLIPGPFVADIDVSSTLAFLEEFSAYASKKKIRFFLVSGYPEHVARERLSQHGLSRFFPKENVYAVSDAYLSQMAPIDRSRYDAKLKSNPACTDEYYRQVAMLEVQKKFSLAKEDCLLVGSDYWFDGFYTRRYAQVDIAFVEHVLTSRGKPIHEKIAGLWYVPLSFKPFQSILEGKTIPPRYQPLETWASLTLTEELLGTQNFNMVKRTILEKKKDGTFHVAESKIAPAPAPSPSPTDAPPQDPSSNDDINPSVV